MMIKRIMSIFLIKRIMINNKSIVRSIIIIYNYDLLLFSTLEGKPNMM